MKYALILPDGAADEPVPELNGQTPLEAARKPGMDWVSTHGRQGRVATVPEGFLPGSDVATLSLFGYDPRIDYDGRAPLEAAAQGIQTQADELIFRCNFVTIMDGVMVDFTAGHISPPEARRLIDDLNGHFRGSNCTFHAGVSYRNLMVASDAASLRLECTPPHDVPDQPVEPYLPRGAGAKWAREIMDQAAELLAGHEVNVVRNDLGENQATHIWLWGPGRTKPVQPFQERFGLRGAVIAAVDLIRGIGRVTGMEWINVPGATGYLDTNYAAKGATAVEALDRFDLVVVHIEAPDEAGHLGDVKAKVQAIERIDEFVVVPVLEKLRSFDRWRLLIAPDHPTPVGKRVHTADPPPFCIAGTAVHSVTRLPFCERSAARSDLLVDPGHELMEFFLCS